MIIIIIFEKMKYKLYTSSKKAWQGMIEEIRKAQKSIYIEMYIFLNDTSDKYDFFGALKERADNGVQVIIVTDYKGSFGLRPPKKSESLNTEPILDDSFENEENI